MADEKCREVQAWMQKADNDLRGAQIDLQANPALIEDALFHCQQAAKKAMKAFLAGRKTSLSVRHMTSTNWLWRASGWMPV